MVVADSVSLGPPHAVGATRFAQSRTGEGPFGPPDRLVCWVVLARVVGSQHAGPQTHADSGLSHQRRRWAGIRGPKHEESTSKWPSKQRTSTPGCGPRKPMSRVCNDCFRYPGGPIDVHNRVQFLTTDRQFSRVVQDRLSEFSIYSESIFGMFVCKLFVAHF